VRTVTGDQDRLAEQAALALDKRSGLDMHAAFSYELVVGSALIP
jgi:hypothetical protein